MVKRALFLLLLFWGCEEGDFGSTTPSTMEGFPIDTTGDWEIEEPITGTLTFEQEGSKLVGSAALNVDGTDHTDLELTGQIHASMLRADVGTVDLRFEAIIETLFWLKGSLHKKDGTNVGKMISIRLSPLPDHHGDDKEHATVLELNEPVTGLFYSNLETDWRAWRHWDPSTTISFESDEDWFSFQPSESGSFVFTADGYELQTILFGAEGALEESQEEPITYPLTANETYYLRVTQLKSPYFTRASFYTVLIREG